MDIERVSMGSYRITIAPNTNKRFRMCDSEDESDDDIIEVLPSVRRFSARLRSESDSDSLQSLGSLYESPEEVEPDKLTTTQKHPLEPQYRNLHPKNPSKNVSGENHWDRVPMELFANIMSYVDQNSTLYCTGMTCKRFYAMIRSLYGPIRLCESDVTILADRKPIVIKIGDHEITCTEDYSTSNNDSDAMQPDALPDELSRTVFNPRSITVCTVQTRLRRALRIIEHMDFGTQRSAFCTREFAIHFRFRCTSQDLPSLGSVSFFDSPYQVWLQCNESLPRVLKMVRPQTVQVVVLLNEQNREDLRRPNLYQPLGQFDHRVRRSIFDLFEKQRITRRYEYVSETGSAEEGRIEHLYSAKAMRGCNSNRFCVQRKNQGRQVIVLE